LKPVSSFGIRTGLPLVTIVFCYSSTFFFCKQCGCGRIERCAMAAIYMASRIASIPVS